MSSIMRARSGLTGRSERLEGIGGFLSRAEGCWTFDARDRMPRSSRPTAHHLADSRTGSDARPARESGFVLMPLSRSCKRPADWSQEGGKRPGEIIFQRLLTIARHDISLSETPNGNLDPQPASRRD